MKIHIGSDKLILPVWNSVNKYKKHNFGIIKIFGGRDLSSANTLI